MPKLVIVGNGPVEKDHSKLVDTADRVIRFNFCSTYTTGMVGTKMDMLAMRQGHGHWHLKRAWSIFPPGILGQFNEVRVYNCRGPAGRHFNYISRYPEMAGKLQMLDTTQWEKARAVLRDGACDHGNWENPTIGFVGLTHVLSDDRFANYDILLVGFTWKVIDEFHPQHSEKQICEQLAKAGTIRLLDQ